MPAGTEHEKLPGWIKEEYERCWRRAVDGMNERRAAEGREPIDEGSTTLEAQRHAHLHGFLSGFRCGVRRMHD